MPRSAMDEDLGVKAPVTRLRRRLSVEVEDSASVPTTPGTPTKKRVARLAAKPQLELINELVTEDVAKKARKGAVKEAVDEAAAAPLTPSRRSTRIRSNTSLLAETTQHVESPRAKRALRRNSQLGSDTESSVTPVRQTRRTRKDSTTSVEKQAGTDNDKVVTSTTEGELNIAESEKASKNPKAGDKSSPSTRRSPRLNKKDTKSDDSTKDIDGDKQASTVNDSKHTPDEITQSATEPNETLDPEDKEEKNSETSNTDKEKLSLSSVVLLEKIIINDKKNSTLNKSTSAIEKIAKDLKNTRKRTKSWTTLSSPTANVAFHSDSESGKLKTKQKTLNTSIGSGDGLLTNGGNDSTIKQKIVPDIRSPNQSLNKSKSTSLISVENKENLIVTNPQFEEFISEINKSDAVKLFEKSPIVNTEPLVIIEDSDSCSVGKLSIDLQMNGEDQCVPIVSNPSTNESPTKVNQSVEPMDIDETMPTNVTIDDFEKSNTSNEESEVLQNDIKSLSDGLPKENSFNKSKRESSVSFQSAVDSERLSINKEKKNNKLDKSKNSSMSAEVKSSTSIHENKYDTTKSNRSSFSLQNDDEKDRNESVKTADKSSRKTSISVSEKLVENNSENSNTSQRKSSIPQSDSETSRNLIKNENNDSSNKTKRKSSISHLDSQNLEKSSNENKSTLVISQLKDVTSNDINNAMSPNINNNELSKSLNGPELIKNKDIDNKNLSLNYLTSTPIQQKTIQKLTMQINTSIISSNTENKIAIRKKNNSSVQSDSDSSDNEINQKIEVETKKKNIVVPNKKTPRKAIFSSDSSDSDNESKITSKNNKINKTDKQSAIKKAPSSDSSDSTDEEIESRNKNKDQKTLKGNPKSSKANAEKAMKKVSRPHSNSESSDDSYEGIMKDLSKVIDDEASEASDDYESGDSRSDEEKRYEAENEIVEKGETLDSEEEFSNDSEYEKDSFLVSSDAEDDEMLSGTGDDLSVTDNELTMSRKSKKKFNDRKQKQQKKASKEMYEARHKINESANSSELETSKSKKSKRQRLESSHLESDDNDNGKPKNKNRLRIDSSQDISMAKSDNDDSIGIKKKKSKRLSESVCEGVNEKEITVCDQSIADKNDPLSIALKQEPKTPQKHFDLSTVAINDNIEEVQVDSNASMIEQNEAIDPLQATMVQDEDSSSSDNMEIIQNYDSVLNNLSKQTKNIKTYDTSLNLNKKAKDSKDPLIDQLNLTVTNKKSKKNKNKTLKEQPETDVKKALKVVSNEDEYTSDSIDMKLLFSEDSNDSEVQARQLKLETQQQVDFIPLRKTAAQTNIPANMDLEESLNKSNVSEKKKNRKSYHCAPDENVTNNVDLRKEPENAFKLIIDTTGTHEGLDTSATQVTSAKKKKNKNKLKNEEAKSDLADNPEDSNINIFVNTTGTHEDIEMGIDTSTTTMNSAKKKKNKYKLNNSKASEDAFEVDCTDGAEPQIEISLPTEKKIKKNRSLNVSINIEDSVAESHSEKNTSRKKSESAFDAVEASTQNAETTIIEETAANVSVKSDKKKKKNKNISINIESVEEESMKNKSKNNSMSADDILAQTQNTEEIQSGTAKSNKKKKNKQKLDVTQSFADNVGEDSDEAPMEMSFRSEKKTDATEIVTDDALATSSEKKKHKKNKKKKNKNLSLTSDTGDKNVTNVNDETEKRKRKLKAADSPTATEDAANVVPKKRKILDDEYVSTYADSNTDQYIVESNIKKSKKDKKTKSNLQEDNSHDEATQQNSKKRKREDDNGELSSKVGKQNSFDSVQVVARLPEHLLNQLDEKPKRGNANKKRSTAAISTVPFVVEDAQRRKNKPSNYLEQSVYLNDSPSKEKQNRSKQRKPKVLPYMPTASTSESGYTSQFNVNVLPKETQFVAQASNVYNFKASCLGKSRVKKLGTLERCKLQRSHKISKF